MSYRNEKRKAAVWVLEQLVVPKKGRVTAIIADDGKRTEVNKQVYDWYGLKELIPTSPYNRELLRDAVDLLAIHNHIDIRRDNYDVYNSSMAALREGEIALREDTYQDDISNYVADKRFRNLRWQIPLLLVILTAVNVGYTFYKDGKHTTEINTLQRQIDSMDREIKLIRDNSVVIPKDWNRPDTTVR